MASLVWANDGEWNGEPVKAGADLPPMTHNERGDLYVAGRAVRKVNGDEKAPTPPPAEVPAAPVLEEKDVDGSVPGT